MSSTNIRVPPIATHGESRVDPDSLKQVMQHAWGARVAAALYTAANLKIPELLAGGTRHVAELARESGSNEDALNRLLRALVSVGVFAETAPRVYANNKMSDTFRSGVPGNMRDMVLFGANPFHFKVIAELPYSVQTGKPAIERVFGQKAFDYFASHPEAHFNEGMTGVSSHLVPAVLEAYDFSGVGTLMDVAGGHGFTLCEILKQYPSMRGILFDELHVIEGAKCFVCERNLEERCQPVAGNFFERIPSGADAYYLQHILHDWPDDEALKILRNCGTALESREDGRLLVVDGVIPEPTAPHQSNWLDLEMLMMPGGRERTESEWRTLLEKAGLQITRIVPTRAPDSVIEARLA